MNSLLARKKIIFLILALFFLLEVGSFLSYYFSVINIVFFGLIVIFSLVLAIYKLEWAFYLVLGELFFNSMGYIFYLENGGFKISLRIALWIVLLSVYLAKFIIQLFKGKRGLWQKYRSILHFNGFILLGLFIVLAFVWGVLKNGFSDAFFDFNAWLYFALLLPLWHILLHKSKDQINDFWQNIIIIFVSSVAYLVFKSLFLLFFFSHNIQPLTLDIYHWTRLYGLGEVTNMGGGFYRVFLQSQIYILLAFIIFLAIWVFDFSKKTKIYLLIFLSFLASALILSFSRSFWLAGISAILLLLLILWFRFGFRKMINTFFITLLSFIFGFILVFLVVKFPWPRASVDFNLDSLTNRANITADESAISSRWALLEIMKGDLQSNFLTGRGFGARLEYKSSDPRVLERTADGLYSTYAFEWGWLDIWLKLGLLGLLAYLYLIFRVIKNLYFGFIKNNDYIYLGLGLSLLVLIIVNFFTPYLNHPLGIGFLILLISYQSKKIC